MTTWGDIFRAAVARGETRTYAAFLADGWLRWPRMPRRWCRPLQHPWRRGHRSQFVRVLIRIRTGTMTVRDAAYLARLHMRVVRAEGELAGMTWGVEQLRDEIDYWRERYMELSERVCEEADDG